MVNRLEKVRDATPDTPLVLHGAHGASDELLLDTIRRGVNKINASGAIRMGYLNYISSNARSMATPVLKVQAVRVYVRDITRYMDLIGSAGKA